MDTDDKQRTITATGLRSRVPDVLETVMYYGTVWIITRNGKPVARIVPITPPNAADSDKQ